MRRERYIPSFDGTELYTSTSGQGPAVLLCDGLGCDGFVWRYLHPALTPDYRVVRWHYRGHGLSRMPSDPKAFRVSDLVGDLYSVMNALEVPQAVLVGHSMGVQVILEFALRYPERVVGLIPTCGSYGRPLDTFHDNPLGAKIFPVVQTLVKRYPSMAQRVWRRLLLSELSYQVALKVELNGRLILRRDFDPYFAHLAAMDVRVFFETLEHLSEHTVEDRLHLIEAPALVIAGEDDTFTPAWLSTRMAQRLPHAELLLVPGGTHAAPIEHPDLVNLRVAAFLDRHAQPSSKPVLEEKPSSRRRASTAANVAQS